MQAHEQDAEPSAASASTAVWESLHGILRGEPDDSGDEDSRSHNRATESLPGAGEEAGEREWDDNWKSFVTKYVDKTHKRSNGSGATTTTAPATMSRAVSTRSAATSYVSELEDQDSGMIQAFQPEAKKGPKKSALKPGGKGGGGDNTSARSASAATSDAGLAGPAGPSAQEKFRIQMPNLDVSAWEGVVHQVVWKLGRHFGFQAFNVDPKTRGLAVQEHTPATIILAGDHLSTLLCKQGYIRRGNVPGDNDMDRFAKAVTELHATIFNSYEHKWCRLVGLPWRTTSAQQVLLNHSFSASRVLNGLLCELGLWFLIYTESSSLRHTPEVMWFIYWCLNSSFVMTEFWHLELPEVEPNARDRRIELRNLHQSLISEIQTQLQIYPRRVRPEDCGRMSSILSRLRDTEAADEDFQLLGDLIAFGDGGFYCDRIVTPLFDVIAYEVDHLSNLGVDVAHRLGYDDVNETMCVRAIVQDTLRELRVKPEQLAQATVNDAYMSITNLGFGVKGAAMSTFDPAVASEFWHTRVFVKTYRERRTWAAVYRAYYRVFCFHIVAYQFLQVLAFTGWDWRMLSSCLVTQAAMKAMERFCNWFMTNEPPEPLNTTLSKVFSNKGRHRMSQTGRRAVQRMNQVMASDDAAARTAAELTGSGLQKVRRRRHVLEGRPLYGMIGFLEWVVLAAFILAWYVAQFYAKGGLRQQLRVWWMVFAGSYVGLHVIHWVLTLRDGYMVSLTHMLAMPALFKASSSRPDATCWLSAPMHMKWKLLGSNAVFWAVVFAMKLPFDYFVICSPVVAPLKIVLYRNWLECQGKWYVYPFPCIGGDWLLLAGRVCPFIVIIFMDTSLFYQVTMTIFGIIRGLFKLDLGVLTSWDEVVKEFYRAPARWWHKCMSEMGNDNQLAKLKQTMYIEDTSTGQVTQVSDGMMFKKTVLTPEEIHGKKVHVSGRKVSAAGAGSASEAGSVKSGAEEKGKGGALLPSSTKRTKAKATAAEDAAADKRMKGQRRAHAEAKASAAKKAVIGDAAESGDEGGNSAQGGVSKMATAVFRTFTSAAMASDADAALGSSKDMQGVKGKLARLLTVKSPGPEQVDEVAQLTAAARSAARKAQTSKAGGGSSAPNARKVELKVQQVAKRKESAASSQAGGPDSEAAGGAGGEDSTQQSGPSGTAAGGGGDGGVMGKLSRMLTRRHGDPSSQPPDQEGDDVDRMARAARVAAIAHRQEQSSEAGEASSPQSGGGAGAMKPRPKSAKPARRKTIIVEPPRRSSLTGDVPSSASPEAKPRVRHAAFALPSESDGPEADKSAAGPPQEAGPVAEGVELWTEPRPARQPRVHRRVPTRPTAMAGLLAGEVGPTACWWHVQEQLARRQELASQQLGLDEVSTTSNSSSVTEDEGPQRWATPTAPDSTWSWAYNGGARPGSGVRAPPTLLGIRTSNNRVAPGPLAEGTQDHLARWLGEDSGSADVQPASAVVRLPPISGMGSAPASQPGADSPASQLPPLQPRNARPMEEEMTEIFGRPIDESRAASLSNGASLPRLVPGGAPVLDVASLPGSVAGAESPVASPRKRGVGFNVSGDVEAPPILDSSSRSGSRIKKSVRVAAGLDDGEKRFDAAEQLVAAVGSAREAGMLDDDKEPMIGRLLSSFGKRTKKDQAAERRSKPKGSNLVNLRAASMIVTTKTSASGEEPQKTGPTAEDLEIDDVHYQMMMWNAFASAWDDVVDDVRHSDLISDKEVGMLKFVRLDLGSRLYGLRSILLPTFFYAGQIRKVVDTGSVSTAQIMVLNELRVLCVWLGCQIGLLSGKHAHVITSAPFYSSNINVKHALHRKKFYTSGVKVIEHLEEMCSRQEVPFDVRDVAEHLFTILTSMEAECFAINKAHQEKRATDDELELSSIMLEVVQQMKHEISKDPEKLKVIFKTAITTAGTANYKELLRVVRVVKRMLVATVAEATPTGLEAQRALGFFINSLSHPSLDRPTSLDKMWSWTIMTPLYEEDVLYPLEGDALAKEMGLKKKKLTDLLTEGDDSISLMGYLKATFPDEWNNFKERMKTLVPEVDVKELSEMDFAPGAWLYDFRMELQLWASCRGQLLGRTVNGMLRNEKALRVLARLEHPPPPDMTDLQYHQWMDQLVTSKFEMVITPQTYGKNRDSKDVRLRWLARSIQLLLQRYPKCLKAAYLEKADVEGRGITEFSVCMKGRDPHDINQLPHMEDQPVYELYRIRLPANKYSARGVIIGEGKPENQNHAVIFAFGEGIQAIDMNQDGYLCEWLKFRNLLAELQPSTRGDFFLYCNDDDEFRITPDLTAAELMCIVRHRMVNNVQTALVGFREYIFSESAGALGRFAAATEYAFGTISQRTMTHPARVRLHYGHPDLFNKLFVMTRGGISKATRLLHLTEDVFCGCNHTLRGARIRYKEYISCGKGRDMGFDSINGFNFKIAGGGGEWAISRESARMGARLDFFRLMAFYHAAVGFYINSWFTYLAVYLNTYALLLFAWAQATEIQADGVERVYNVQQVLQLGTLALIPYAGQLMLEHGIIRTTLTLFQQIATGSLLFYTFQQQTVAASFSADMSYGSGKYVGTGRGFNIVSLEFVKIFTLYARSHLYMAFELMFALSTLYIVKDCPSCNYGALTWSAWLLVVFLIFAPLWFNPLSFDVQKVANNYLAWRRWMDGDVDHTTGSNWYTWNTVQLEKIRNDNGNNTDNWLNVVGVLISTAPYVLMALGAASRLDICLEVAASNEHPVLCNGYLIFLIATAAIWVLAHTTIVLRHHWLDLANHKSWRVYTWMVSVALIAFLISFLLGVQRVLKGRAMDVLFLVLYANFNLLVAFHKVITPLMSQNNTMRAFSDWFFYTVDTLIGYTMFVLMALLSFIGIVGVLQMKLLFNDTFSEQVKHAKIGRAMKDQKVMVDASKAGMGSAPGSAMGARPSTAASTASGATAFTARTMVKSEHRYM